MEFPQRFSKFCITNYIVPQLRCKQSHLEWFDVKWFIVEKLTDPDLLSVVVIGTRGRHHECTLKMLQAKSYLRTVVKQSLGHQVV